MSTESSSSSTSTSSPNVVATTWLRFGGRDTPSIAILPGDRRSIANLIVEAEKILAIKPTNQTSNLMTLIQKILASPRIFKECEEDILTILRHFLPEHNLNGLLYHSDAFYLFNTPHESFAAIWKALVDILGVYNSVVGTLMPDYQVNLQMFAPYFRCLSMLQASRTPEADLIQALLDFFNPQDDLETSERTVIDNAGRVKFRERCDDAIEALQLPDRHF